MSSNQPFVVRLQVHFCPSEYTWVGYRDIRSAPRASETPDGRVSPTLNGEWRKERSHPSAPDNPSQKVEVCLGLRWSKKLVSPRPDASSPICLYTSKSRCPPGAGVPSSPESSPWIKKSGTIRGRYELWSLRVAPSGVLRE